MVVDCIQKEQARLTFKNNDVTRLNVPQLRVQRQTLFQLASADHWNVNKALADVFRCRSGVDISD